MQIPLSQGRFAEVDPQDHARFSHFRWCYRADRNQGPGCAVRHVKVNGKDRLSYLHREIMDPPPGTDVIFLNYDRLDCRRQNLKVVNKHEARWHHRPRHDSETGIKGIKLSPSGEKWYAGITRFGYFHHLGAFDTEEAAIAAYKKAEERLSQPDPDATNPENSNNTEHP